MKKQKVRRIKAFAAGVAFVWIMGWAAPCTHSTQLGGSWSVQIFAEICASLSPWRVTTVREGGRWCGYVW